MANDVEIKSVDRNLEIEYLKATKYKAFMAFPHLCTIDWNLALKYERMCEAMKGICFVQFPNGIIRMKSKFEQLFKIDS